jgi:hypothetical protein
MTTSKRTTASRARRGTAVATGILLAVLASLPAQGTTAEDSLEAVAELARSADRVFRGRCLEVAEGEATVGGVRLPVTVYTFRVLDPIQGSASGTVSFRQVGRPQGGPGDLGELAGLPRYEPGGEYVLFLLPDSRAGLTSPAGAAEGAFTMDGERAVQIPAAHSFQRAASGAPADGEPHTAASRSPSLALPYAELRRAAEEAL